MRDIAFLVYPGYSLMALAVTAGFEVANSMVDPQPYDLHFVSETGGPIRTSAGMMLQTEVFTEKPFDTLVVGGATFPKPSSPGLIAFMLDAPKRHRRIAAVCTGAFVLAEAGLLHDADATTHWEDADDLARRHPTLRVRPERRWVDNGRLVTSAGIAAGIDMSLHLVARLVDLELARRTARQLDVPWSEA